MTKRREGLGFTGTSENRFCAREDYARALFFAIRDFLQN